MIRSSGTLSYSAGEPFRLVVDVDQGLVDMYRALVPPYVRLRRQRWPAHITVVRNEPILCRGPWAAHQGATVEFEFDPVVAHDLTYHWLNVTCPRLSELRIELGLTPSSALTRPPDGSEFFHITLGNTREG